MSRFAIQILAAVVLLVAGPSGGTHGADGSSRAPLAVETIGRITILACGTSWHSGLVGKFLIESAARIPCEVDLASEFRYRDPVLDGRSLVIGISQSGPLPWKNENIERPPAVNLKATGKYLVDNLSCYDCHSKSFMAIDKLEPEKSKGYMGGGNKLKDRSGKTVVSPNLTPHVTGIADWKEEDLARALRKGQNKDKEIISFPMPMYSELTDKEVGAIYAYLMSLPPIKNETKQAE